MIRKEEFNCTASGEKTKFMMKRIEIKVSHFLLFFKKKVKKYAKEVDCIKKTLKPSIKM